MKSTTPRDDAQTNRDDKRKDKTDAKRSSADNTGGAPASEEDIGTEGAGTEPRDTTEVGNKTDAPPRNTRGGKGAA